MQCAEFYDQSDGVKIDKGYSEKFGVLPQNTEIFEKFAKVFLPRVRPSACVNFLHDCVMINLKLCIE